MHDILVFVLAISPPPTKISYHLQMRVNNNNNNNNTQYNYNYIYTPNNTYISVMILYKVLYKETIVYIMSDMNKCGVVHINTTTTQTHTPQCHKTTHYKRNSYESCVMCCLVHSKRNVPTSWSRFYTMSKQTSTYINHHNILETCPTNGGNNQERRRRMQDKGEDER